MSSKLPALTGSEVIRALKVDATKTSSELPQTGTQTDATPAFHTVVVPSKIDATKPITDLPQTGNQGATITTPYEPVHAPRAITPYPG